MYCYKACVLTAKKSCACLFLATLNLFKEEAVRDFGTEKKSMEAYKEESCNREHSLQERLAISQRNKHNRTAQRQQKELIFFFS